MKILLRRFPQARTLVMGAATLTLFWLPAPASMQAQASQDTQASQDNDPTHRDLALFAQFLDSHREISSQLQSNPALIGDPQYVQNHPELNTYLQGHPSVRAEVTDHPDLFMSIEDKHLPPPEQGEANPSTTPVTRRDLARFDQFLQTHQEIASQLRASPFLIGDPQYVENHPALNTYLQEHPGVKQEITDHPDLFMSMEDQWAKNPGLRDHDAGWQGGDGDRNEGLNRDAVEFDRFLDQHREIGELVRKNPSLLDDRQFVDNHPELRSYLQDHPQIREQIMHNPNGFMQLADRDNHDANWGGQGNGGRDGSLNRDAVEFDHFLDQHRELSQLVRSNPSLLDDRQFVDNHPALKSYLQDHPQIREQVMQNPNGFMQLADRDNGGDNRWRPGEPRPMDDRMMAFSGFLGNHDDIRNDLQRNPEMVKDQSYLQNHSELNSYLTAHPDVRAELMQNPQDFVHGAQQYNGANVGGAGVSGRGAGTSATTGTTGSAGVAGSTGASTGAGTSTTSSTTTHDSKPNQ
jgi:hypothetical protein